MYAQSHSSYHHYPALNNIIATNMYSFPTKHTTTSTSTSSSSPSLINGYEQPYDQQQCHPLPPPHQDDHQHHSGRRKRSIHFEPEFYEVLDSSLRDSYPYSYSSSYHSPSSSSSPYIPSLRPTKKLRRNIPSPLHLDDTTTTVPSSPSTSSTNSPIITSGSPLPNRPRSKSRSASPELSQKSLEGPNIVDLSSGEELDILNLGENDHKRRRESLVDPHGAAESVQEVYDVLPDGSVQASIDELPLLPSPTKRRRRKGRFLSGESGSSSGSGSSDNDSDIDKKSLKKRRDIVDASANDDVDMNGDGDQANAKPATITTTKTTPKSRVDLMALIRYEGPRTMSLVNGAGELMKEKWHGHQPSETLCSSTTTSSIKGNELILYQSLKQPPLSTQAFNTPDPTTESSTVIVELNDDDVSDSEVMMQELEDKIMYMDLD